MTSETDVVAADLSPATGPRQSERADEVKKECVRTLFRQIPNSFAAAMGVTAYLVVTLWHNAPHHLIGWWLAAQAAAQVQRFVVYGFYRRARLTTENAPLWARRYTYYMLSAGLVWALVPFLFFRPESPFSQVFTMCGLYGIAGGSVSGQAYHPPALRAFVMPMFVSVMLRMLGLGTVAYLTLGVASLFYMGILLAFCRVQHLTVLESIRIRFENIELVAELKSQKAAAEEAKTRAEQADLAKSRFLAAASHDLRQPLHALGLFSATLLSLELDARQKSVVGQIHRNIDSLEALFDELLDISKLDAGYIQATPAHLPMERVLERLRDRYEALADDKGLRLRIRACSAVVHTDEMLLERILGNLVQNAIRYTERGGVLVACRKRYGVLRVEVWDSGIGIADDQREKVFEEFFQVGNPERDRRKGLGLGLAIARRVARLLGTDVELDSRPGRGSVFRMDVPLGDAARVIDESEEPSPTSDALSGRSVIVIDDEAAIRDGMRNLMTEWGCAPLVAESADEAIALVESSKGAPSLIIADYRLRDHATGAEAVARLRERFGAPIPAVLITGDTSPERIAEAARSGLHLLHKPVRPAQLRAMCNYLLTSPPSEA